MSITLYSGVVGRRGSMKAECVFSPEKTIVSILLRVLYARLLAPATKINILMLDEPTADLDSIRVGYLRQMLFKISKMMNMQVIMVTHDESVIPDQANLIVINTQLR